MTTVLPATCFHPRRGWPSAGFIGVRVARVNFTYRSRPDPLCALNTFEFIPTSQGRRRGCRGRKGGGRGCYLCGMARVTYTQGGITFIRQPVAPFRPKVNSRLTRNGDLSHPFSPFDFLKVESEFSPISKCMIRSFIIVPRFKIQFRFAQYNIHPILSR